MSLMSDLGTKIGTELKGKLDKTGGQLSDSLQIGTLGNTNTSTFQEASNAAGQPALFSSWVYAYAIEAPDEKATQSTLIAIGNDGKFNLNTDIISFVTYGEKRLEIDVNGVADFKVNPTVNGTLVSLDGHGHTIADVTDLQTTLDGKSDTSHTHSYLPLTGGTMTGSLTINATSQPQIICDGGDNLHGDIVVPDGEILQIGHWNSSTETFTNRLNIDADGVLTSNGDEVVTSSQISNFIRNDQDVTILGNLQVDTGGSYNHVMVKGDGGHVAINTNDGMGNANLVFNHHKGIPDTNGSSGRIECSVDSTTAGMYFELKDNVTNGTSIQTETIMSLTTSNVTVSKNMTVQGDQVMRGTKHISTSAPLSTDGVDGDVWYQV